MRVPKYRKRAGRDTAFVEWQGRRVQLPGAHNSHESKLAYASFLEKHVLTEATIVNKPQPTAITVGMLALGFLDYCKKRYKPPSVEFEKIDAALNWLIANYATMRVTDFGPLALMELRETHIATGNCRNYINSQIDRVKRCFRWGVTRQLVSGNQFLELQAVPGLRAGETPAPDHPEVEPVEWSIVAATAAHANDNVAAMILAQWFIGCRAKSICLMKPEQIDRGHAIWRWNPRHKQEHTRKRKLVLAIGPRAQRVLLPFLERRQPYQYVFQPRDIRNSDRYGNCYTRRSYNQGIMRAIQKANALLLKADETIQLLTPGAAAPPKVRHWSSHQLRHAKGHDTSERYGAAATQAVLGHDSAKATQIYASPRVEIERLLSDENEARRLELATRVAEETG